MRPYTPTPAVTWNEPSLIPRARNSSVPTSSRRRTRATTPCARASAMAKRASPRAMGRTWRGPSPSAESLSRELDPDGALVAAGRVGLITHKDCKPAMAEALGIPAERRAISPVCAGATPWSSPTSCTVVGTPEVRPELIARLARAYYHADRAADRRNERARRGWHRSEE